MNGECSNKSSIRRNTAALTGGIATGKSTVSDMFRELGAHLIDADIVARQVVEPGQPAYFEIVKHFGQEILLEDGRLDRKKLGAVIFQHQEEREHLNQMTHPRVIAAFDAEETQIHASDPDRLILVDVPLLIETGMYRSYPAIILVYAPETAQLQRLMERDRLSEEDARRRIAAQMPIDEKLSYATHVIRNAGGRDETFAQVQAIYASLKNNHARV
jgi:dephospho-CoA kinase